jgi:heat shock protein HtpX
MTREEIAGLAHEIAHIRGDDSWIMTWAAAMCPAMTQLSLIGAVNAGFYNRRKLMDTPLAALLSAAPAVGQLLWLGLSRIRESDAVALELVDDPQALIAALGKLERHHTGTYPQPLTERASRISSVSAQPSSHVGTRWRSHEARGLSRHRLSFVRLRSPK